MTIRYTSSQRFGIWILAGGLVTLVFSISLFSSSMPSVVVNSYAQQNETTQNLTETNIPKVLPLVRGFTDGNEVFYITTEVSDEKLANYLSNLLMALKEVVQKDFSQMLQTHNLEIISIHHYGKLIL
jgi:hypothetical protein